MAKRARSKEQKDQCRLANLLSSAFFEWLVIIMLFLSAILSYLATRLARFCKLQTPCLLCSRLDHIWGDEKVGFCKDLLCNSHKLEVASLGYCHIHRKLDDVKEMCETCLLSLAKKNPGEGDNVRSNGLTSKYYGEDMVKVPLLDNDLECTRYCSCCSAPIRGNPSGHSLLQRSPIEGDIAELGIIVHSHSQHAKGLSKRSGNSSRSQQAKQLCNFGFDRLSHVGYSELKIHSDSESEVTFSDDDEGNLLTRGTESLKVELVPTVISKDLSITSSDHPTQMLPEQSLIALEKQQASENISKSNVAIGHGLEEINWNQVEERENISTAREFLPEQVLTKLDDTQTGDATKAASSVDMNSKKMPIVNDQNPPSNNNTDLNDGSKLGNVNIANSTPLTSTEIVAGKEATKVQEDLRLLLSQISAARGLEFSNNEMSPSPRLSNASSTTGSQYSKRYEANELESLYGIVNEIEGESPVDRLKRQIEFDRKALTIMFKELEEERSASSIAANQAMAMINRLQEEKAAMQMEAWQYQRMMEEQAEYDQEALEKLNDILAEREKDIQDLESEIDNYRKRFGEEPLNESVEREYIRTTSTPRLNRSTSRQNSYRSLEPGYTPTRFMKDSLMDIEDEKAYMLQCLKRLEKKLQMFPIDGEDGLPQTEDNVQGVHQENANGQLESGAKNTQISEEAVEATEKVLEKKKSYLASGDSTSLTKEKRLLYSSSNNNIQYPMIGKTCDVIVLGDEVSQLNERLEALEADRDFLDRALNSLKNGTDGVQFIREIACHLRELRRIGIRLRKNMVA